VINAVAHRDYFEKGANVMVEMFDNRIEITSYGGLVKGLKQEDFSRLEIVMPCLRGTRPRSWCSMSEGSRSQRACCLSRR